MTTKSVEVEITVNHLSTLTIRYIPLLNYRIRHKSLKLNEKIGNIT